MIRSIYTDSRNTVHFRKLLSTLLVISACSTSPALAQDLADDEAAAAALDNNAIIVTATRRASTVQETPIAITAYDGEALSNAGVTDMNDLSRLSPSLRIQDEGPGRRRLSLRGINAAGEPTIGYYYDETPIVGNLGIGSDSGGRTPDFSLFDINRVEVLRGPQGTLYGASSMGGAIRVILNKPSFEFEGAFEGTISGTKYGGFNYIVNGMVNAPLVDDVLAARVVLYRKSMEGYIDNIQLGRENVNDYVAEGGRVLLRFTPTSNFTIDASAMLENTDAENSNWDPNYGKYNIPYNIHLPYEDRSKIYNVTAEWDAGPITLTAITSFQDRDFHYTSGDDSVLLVIRRNEADCSRIFNDGMACDASTLADYYTYLDDQFPIAFETPGWTEAWSHEFRISSSTDGPFQWTLGAFLEDRKNYFDSQDVYGDPETGIIYEPTQFAYHRYVNDHFEQSAIYGEASLELTDKFTVTAGARYFDYQRSITGETDIPWPILNAPLRPPYLVESDESGTLLKFNADYRITPDIMIYALAAQGIRPGGANQTIGLPEELIQYDSDELWNYEVGIKSSLMNNRLIVNSAIFQVDWDRLQVSGRTPDGFYRFITNVGGARIRGAEVEIVAEPAPGLTLNASATYLDAVLTADQVSDYIVATGQEGDRLPFIPRWNATVGGEYRGGLSPEVDFYARVDANYFGASYSEFDETAAFTVRVGDYLLANARAGIETVDGVWGAYVFVTNVFDKVAINRASNSAFSYSINSAAPRTIGLTVRRDF